MEGNSFSIVGILNTTPDSFYDGGRYRDTSAIEEQVDRMVREGADIIDIGGESTFVDRDHVSVETELERTIFVIDLIQQKYPSVDISIDTYKAVVAAKAIDAGATMVNDVTAGRGDADMFSLIADTGVKYVMMYAKDASSRTTTDRVEYDDVMATVKDFLSQRMKVAHSRGIEQDQIILDPGLGFFLSGNPKYSFEVLQRLSELVVLGKPVFVSPSRKSFLAGTEKLPPQERLPATIAASTVAVMHGATYIRTHDVAAVSRGCEVAASVLD